MNIKLTLLLTLILLMTYRGTMAQGCSDAGFCTMGAMKPDQTFNKKIDFKLRSLELSYYQGTTTSSPIVRVVNADISVGITNKTGFQIKLPYQFVTGNFGNTASIGDISLAVTHNFLDSEKFDVNATFGVKIPSNKSNLASDGSKVPGTEGDQYPMYYQTSLGSFDIVIGGSVISKHWMFAIGYQQALTANDNRYDSAQWMQEYPSPSYVQEYPESTLLKRGSDIMLRAEYNFRFVKYNITVGLLPIFRIKKDQIFDDTTESYYKLDGTTGLALSALAGFGYNLNVNNTLKLTYGVKLKQRVLNPDGLTRNTVLIIAYLFRF